MSDDFYRRVLDRCHLMRGQLRSLDAAISSLVREVERDRRRLLADMTVGRLAVLSDPDCGDVTAADSEGGEAD